MPADRPHLTPQRVKAIQVLAEVDRHGTATRRALADATGLRTASLNRLVASLLDGGLLRAADHATTGRPGRPRERLSLEPAAAAVVGLEFGRDRLVATVVDATGALRHVEEDLPAPPFEGTEATMDALEEAVATARRRAGVGGRPLAGVGIALHDVVTAEGRWRTVDRRNGAGFDVRTALARRLGCLVVVDDVSRAFAEAEHRFGAGRGERDLVYVFIGSHGVGGGAFVNDRMLVSSSGICVEIGHVVVREDGALCQCGSTGCFETVASPRAALARLDEVVRQGVASRLAPPVSFGDLCTAAAEGDPAAGVVLRELGDAMARALGATVNLIGAPTVVLGGALRAADRFFLQHVSAALRERVVSGLAARVDVRYAELPHHAGALGAAVRTREEALHAGAFFADLPHDAVTSPRTGGAPRRRTRPARPGSVRFHEEEA